MAAAKATLPEFEDWLASRDVDMEGFLRQLQVLPPHPELEDLSVRSRAVDSENQDWALIINGPPSARISV